MSSSDFKFKQFTIAHDQSSMKVGTDGTLLGAWTTTGEAKTVLDIGTGSGLIALMLAQRTNENVCIDAVEIEQLAFEQATDNIKKSPWPQKIKTHHTSLQDFVAPSTYDLIVSNPPYFQNSQKPPNEKRGLARHTASLSYPDLLTAAQKLLTTVGRLNVILPFKEGLQFITLAEQSDLFCNRQWSFRTRNEKPIERWLLEFSATHHQKEEGEIILYREPKGEEWSEGYKALTREFYLKL